MTHVIDYNLLIKCLTLLLVVSAVVLIIFKSKWKGFKVKTKYGDIELDRNGAEPIADKKDEKSGYSNITVDRELRRIIGKINIRISRDAFIFVIKNKLYNKTKREMETYIDDKIEVFKQYYNDEFKKSDILKKYNLEELLGDDERHVKRIVKDYFLNIYSNHCENYEKKIKWLKTHENKTVTLSLIEENEGITSEIVIYDVEQIDNCLKEICSIIKKCLKEKMKVYKE